MIKPATLWAQFKTCGDSKWIGDICRALGGQEVDLDFGQRQMLNTIIADSGWMDERMEARKEATRKRVAAFRAKQEQQEDVTLVTPCNALQALQTDVTPHPSVHPSIHPSIRPLRLTAYGIFRARAHARGLTCRKRERSCRRVP